MKLIELTLADYVEVLGSNAPAPGGGSASALCGAQGAALAAMVAELTIGKKKYEEDWALCEKVIEKEKYLYAELLKQIDVDTEAFNLVSAAFKMPKDTDEEKAARSQAIADATLVATQVPFHTMELSIEALEIAHSLYGHSNANALSDLGVAGLNLLSCVKGAWLNVLINLGGVKDADKAADFRNKGQEIVNRAEALEAELFTAIAESL